MTGPVVRTFRPTQPTDLRLTLGVLRRGRTDPCMRVAPAEVWRATRTPHGPATVRITAAAGVLTMQAWGRGAGWAVEAFPALVGAHDDEGLLASDSLGGIVGELRRRLWGLRLCRSAAVVEALVPSVIEQKVVGSEARRSYARLVRTLGEPAPGPAAGLLVPPTPEMLSRTPAYVFHRLGIERKRADTIRVACSYAHRLEEVVRLDRKAACARLQALPGVGAWTAAEVLSVALGDPDAVSVGDYHIPHHVAWTLAGEPRADDARMLELLEPYRGQRGRVIRLIMAGGPAPPRFGPRLPLQSIARL